MTKGHDPIGKRRKRVALDGCARLVRAYCCTIVLSLEEVSGFGFQVPRFRVQSLGLNCRLLLKGSRFRVSRRAPGPRARSLNCTVSRGVVRLYSCTALQLYSLTVLQLFICLELYSCTAFADGAQCQRHKRNTTHQEGTRPLRTNLLEVFRARPLGQNYAKVGPSAWISGFGIRVLGFGFQVSGSEIRISGFGVWDTESGFWVSGSGFGVSSVGCRVGSGVGCRVPGFLLRVM